MKYNILYERNKKDCMREIKKTPLEMTSFDYEF